MIDKTVSIPIYDAELRIQITDTYEQFEEAVSVTGFGDDLGGAGAIALRYESHPKLFHIIFNREDLSPGNIAHECLHVTNRLMNTVGIEYSYTNDEAMCYIIGFVVDAFHQTMTTDELTD